MRVWKRGWATGKYLIIYFIKDRIIAVARKKIDDPGEIKASKKFFEEQEGEEINIEMIEI